MKTTALLIPAIVLLAAAACQTLPKVNTETKAGTDFGRYRSFALLPLPQPAVTTDPGARVRLAEPARRAVIEALTTKGYQEGPRESADLAVNLRGQSLPKVEVTDLGFHYPVYTARGRVDVVRNPYTSVDTYQERTLSIEIYDTRTKDQIWVGWCSQRGTGTVKVETVTNAIHRILLQLPPASGATAPR